jgi:hypothetical protein
MGAEGAAVRSAYISIGLGIVSLLLLCADFYILANAAASAVLGSASGWTLILVYYGLPMPLGVAAVILGIRAATRADNEPRTAADNQQRQAAAVGAACGFVSLVVSAALLLVSLVVWLGSILCPSSC